MREELEARKYGMNEQVVRAGEWTKEVDGKGNKNTRKKKIIK